ncbi:MAG: AraC family transcriptional regulator [Lewinella sp.]
MQPPFFDFNLYSSLLLIGWLQGTVYAILLMARSYRHRRLSDLFAALILLVATFYVAQWMLGFGGWYDAHDWRTTLMFYISWDNLLLLGPLIYLYFRAVTNSAFHWSGRLAWHFLPWLLTALPSIAAVGYDLIYLRGIAGQPLPGFFGTRGPFRESFWLTDPAVINGLATITYLQLITYLVVTARDYRRYRNYLTEAFSDLTGRTFTGLGSLLVVLVAGIVLTIVVAGYQSAYGEAPYVKEWFHHLTLSGMAFAAGIQFLQVDGDRIGSLQFRIPEVEAVSDTREADVAENLAAIFARTQTRLGQHRDYLEPDLRLKELAERILVQDKQLSAAINASSGQNFNDYINGLRCSYFVNLLERGDHRERTLLALALEAGFNSKSTFNRAFRKYYGCSPKEAIVRMNDGENLSQKMI